MAVESEYTVKNWQSTYALTSDQLPGSVTTIQREMVNSWCTTFSECRAPSADELVMRRILRCSRCCFICERNALAAR